jgi:hypothetical protein
MDGFRHGRNPCLQFLSVVGAGRIPKTSNTTHKRRLCRFLPAFPLLDE